jgi:hypothetical protein
MPFKATMLLADSAQVSEGKLHLLGGGWTFVGPDPTPTAIALIISVSWDLTNRQHRWRLELVDSDGNPVTVTTPLEHEEPVALEGVFEVGRPPGTPQGTDLNVPVAINLGPLPLESGTRYEWRLTINTESDEDWRLPFNTRPRAELESG